jgi:hypothetical protein
MEKVAADDLAAAIAFSRPEGITRKPNSFALSKLHNSKSAIPIESRTCPLSVTVEPSLSQTE